MKNLKAIFINIAVVNLLLTLCVVTIIVLPRDWTREFRHAIARVVMSLWGVMSRLLGLVHDDFWQRGNGL